MDLQTLYDEEAPDVEKLMAAINSPWASRFKESWTAFVTEHQLLRELLQQMEKYGDASPATPTASEVETQVESAYAQCRDKVCEIVAARAMFKPLLSSGEKAETRLALVQKAARQTRTLGGRLQPKLHLRFRDMLQRVPEFSDYYEDRDVDM